MTTTDDLRTRAREAAEESYPRAIEGTRTTRSIGVALREGYIEGFLAHAAQQPTRDIDVDELARVIDQAADDWDLGIGNGGQTWEHALARAVVAHLTKGNENDE